MHPENLLAEKGVSAKILKHVGTKITEIFKGIVS
jgi:hypothetical protein